MKTTAKSLKKSAITAAAWLLIPSAPLLASTQELAISLSEPPDGVELSAGWYTNESFKENGKEYVIANVRPVDVRLDDCTKEIKMTANFSDTCPEEWRNEDGVEYDAFWQVAEIGQALQPLVSMKINSKNGTRSQFTDQSLRADCEYDPKEPPALNIYWSDVGKKDATCTINLTKCAPEKCFLVVLQVKWYKKKQELLTKNKTYMAPIGSGTQPPYPTTAILIRPYKVPELECDPITTDIEGNAIINPAGIAGGGVAVFRMRKTSKTPASAAGLVWKLGGYMPAGCSFVNGNNVGDSVKVQAGAPSGDFEYNISLTGDFPDNKLKDGPITLSLIASKPKQVKVTVVIVDGAVPGAPETVAPKINDVLAKVNMIYKQAGMEFVLNGPPQLVTSQQIQERVLPNSPLSEKQREFYSKDLPSAQSKILQRYLSNTGGLELYIIKNFNDITGGIHWPSPEPQIRMDYCGSTVAMNGGEALPATTIAHEFGHACDLMDIYNDYSGSDSNTITAGTVPNDWPGGTASQGYYSRSLRLGQLRERLLMNGYNIGMGIDIPAGEVFGRSKAAGAVTVRVGLTSRAGDIIRQPVD